jgi:iron complex outermembrane receptor protein
VVTGATVPVDTQTGVSYELGVEVDRDGLRAKAMIYRLDLRDEIAFDSSGFFNINLDETQRRGALLELAASPVRRLWAGFTWSFVDAEVTDGAFEGSDLPLVAEHSGSFYARYHLGQAWQLYGEVVAVSDRVLGGDFANQFPRLSAYHAVNLHVSYEHGPWRLSARLNNALDEEYSETGAVGFDEAFVLRDAYFPAPGRNGWISLSYRFE